MKPRDKKSININAETHAKINGESHRTRKPVYALVDEAWQMYEKAAVAQMPVAVDADQELIRRLLRLWYEPEGVMEPHIRALVAKAIGLDPPK